MRLMLYQLDNIIPIPGEASEFFAPTPKGILDALQRVAFIFVRKGGTGSKAKTKSEHTFVMPKYALKPSFVSYGNAAAVTDNNTIQKLAKQSGGDIKGVIRSWLEPLLNSIEYFLEADDDLLPPNLLA